MSIYIFDINTLILFSIFLAIKCFDNVILFLKLFPTHSIKYSIALFLINLTLYFAHIILNNFLKYSKNSILFE
jgi:hypothetical protein